MSYGSEVVESHAMKVIRRKYTVTLMVRPESENVIHIRSLFHSIPGDARMESMDQHKDGSVVIVFTEEQTAP